MDQIKIAQVDHLDGDIVVVAFTDGTSRQYKAAMLHALREETEEGTEAKADA